MRLPYSSLVLIRRWSEGVRGGSWTGREEKLQYDRCARTVRESPNFVPHRTIICASPLTIVSSPSLTQQPQNITGAMASSKDPQWRKDVSQSSRTDGNSLIPGRSADQNSPSRIPHSTAVPAGQRPPAMQEDPTSHRVPISMAENLTSRRVPISMAEDLTSRRNSNPVAEDSALRPVSQSMADNTVSCRDPQSLGERPASPLRRRSMDPVSLALYLDCRTIFRLGKAKNDEHYPPSGSSPTTLASWLLRNFPSYGESVMEFYRPRDKRRYSLISSDDDLSDPPPAVEAAKAVPSPTKHSNVIHPTSTDAGNDLSLQPQAHRSSRDQIGTDDAGYDDSIRPLLQGITISEPKRIEEHDSWWEFSHNRTIRSYPEVVDVTRLNKQDPQSIVLQLVNTMIQQLDPWNVEDTFLTGRRICLNLAFVSLIDALFPRLEEIIAPDDLDRVIQESLQTWTEYTLHLEQLYISHLNLLLIGLEHIPAGLETDLIEHVAAKSEEEFDSMAWFHQHVLQGVTHIHRHYHNAWNGIRQTHQHWEEEFTRLREVASEITGAPEIFDTPFALQPRWMLTPVDTDLNREPPEMFELPELPEHESAMEIIEASGLDFDTPYNGNVPHPWQIDANIDVDQWPFQVQYDEEQ